MAQALPEDLGAIWRRVREEVRSSLPPSTYKLWLEPLRVVSAHRTTLYVTGPERVRTWVERRYARRLEHALAIHTTALREVEFVATEDAPVPDRTAAEEIAGPPDPRHTFERFVIGAGNRLAHGAALAVAELPGEAYNPLFVHGAPGLGKTHLLGAITHYLNRNHPELRVRYTTAERFTSEFVAAVRASRGQGFKQRHRAIDVLLIDDVQFLEDKPQTEEEFFHTFDALHATGSQIILAGDRPPHALSRLAERLRDRFEWGLCAEIARPDLPTRMTLLGRLASEAPIELEAPSTLQEIAALAPANLRQLEGALTRVIALASITGQAPTARLAREALACSTDDRADPPNESTATPGVLAIQDVVSSVLGLSRDELISPSRSARTSRARHLAMYLTRELTGLSLAEIARAFRRDHSTVLHAIRGVSRRIANDPDTHDQLARARALLTPADDPDLASSKPSTGRRTVHGATPLPSTRRTQR